jgi:phospholipase/carboxylesterase
MSMTNWQDKPRPSARITRRNFCALSGGMLASGALAAACGVDALPQATGDARLTARPRTGIKTSAVGLRPLGLDEPRDGLVKVPATAQSGAVPLLVFLHGAGQDAAEMLEYIGSAAETAGVAILVPNSRGGGTWDAIRGGFGRDVAYLNRALERVFETVAVDPERVAVGGFSDGATYALSIGLINGDLFRRVAAFSPGFVVGGPLQGKPRFFVSHGTADTVLPIDRCSRVIVPELRRHGYDVTFREFEGGHGVPAAIAKEGLGWVAGR